MPHIHTKPGQHDFTTSAYIVRLDTSEPTVMLHQHKLLHSYLQFGGHVELHENTWQALVHEVEEESGYTIDQLELLQPSLRLETATDAIIHPTPLSIQTHQFSDHDHYHTDIAYAFVTDQPPARAVGEGESTVIEAFSADELAAIPAGEIIENVRESALFVLEEILPNWQRVKASDFER